MKNFSKILVASAFGACLALSAQAQKPRSADGEVILHAWTWSLDTIAANMKLIADAGYDYVQTSPVDRKSVV